MGTTIGGESVVPHATPLRFVANYKRYFVSSNSTS